MKFFLDVHVPSALATWLIVHGHQAQTFLELGWERAEDRVVFEALRDDGCVILSKDQDFSDLVTSLGQPPQLLWLRCGNASTKRLVALFEVRLESAVRALLAGAPIVVLE